MQNTENDRVYSVPVVSAVKITEEDIQDLVTTALCGGIGYWAKLDNSTEDFENAPVDECIDETVARLLMEGKSVELIDEEDGVIYEWTLDKLLKGVELSIGGGCGPTLENGSLDMTSVDNEVADVIVQMGIFGEIIYG